MPLVAKYRQIWAYDQEILSFLQILQTNGHTVFQVYIYIYIILFSHLYDMYPTILIIPFISTPQWNQFIYEYSIHIPVMPPVTLW